MNVLITGGAGFIGSHLCDFFVDQNHTVVVVDNLITGNKENIKHLLEKENFTFIETDCTTEFDLRIKPDLIYHLASPASPPKYQQYPIETLLVNTLGTKNMLELAKDHGCTFVFASTSEVYGDPQEHPQKESYWGNVNPNGLRSCYDEGKRAGESFVLSFIRKFDIDARIIRIFNTYGPRMDIDDGRVVVNFIKQIKNKNPLTVYGKGDQTRSFCYVSDMVKGLIMFGLKENLQGEIINVGNPSEMTVLDLAHKIKTLTKYDGEIIFSELPQDDPKRRLPDISKAQKLLDWEPQIDVDEGLVKTLTHFGI